MVLFSRSGGLQKSAQSIYKLSENREQGQSNSWRSIRTYAPALETVRLTDSSMAVLGKRKIERPSTMRVQPSPQRNLATPLYALTVKLAALHRADHASFHAFAARSPSPESPGRLALSIGVYQVQDRPQKIPRVSQRIWELEAFSN